MMVRTIAIAALGAAVSSGWAQEPASPTVLTAQDYARAEQFMSWSTSSLVTGGGAHQFVQQAARWRY